MQIARHQEPSHSSLFARENLLGAVALGISVAAGGSVGFCLYMFREHARYVDAFPPGVISGGAAFALNFYPYLMALISLGMGFSGCCLLAGSCWLSKSEGRSVFSFLHVASAVWLLPFFCLAMILIRCFFR